MHYLCPGFGAGAGSAPRIGKQIQHPGSFAAGLHIPADLSGHKVPVYRLFGEQPRVLEARRPHHKSQPLIADLPAFRQLPGVFPMTAAGTGPQIYGIGSMWFHGPHRLGVRPQEGHIAPAFQFVAVTGIQNCKILPIFG